MSMSEPIQANPKAAAAAKASAGGAPDPKAGAAPTSASAAADPSKTGGASPTSGTAPAKEGAAPAAKAQGADGKPVEGPAKPEGGEKPVDKKPDRTAAVVLAEREARLVEASRTLKTERETLANEKKAHDAEIAAARAIIDAAKGGRKMAVIESAAKAAGMPVDAFLEAIQDEYLGSVREPTADEKVARLVEDRLAAERKKQADETKAAEDKKLADAKDQAAAGYKAFCDDTLALATEMGPKFAEQFDLCAAFDVGPQDVAARAQKELVAGKPCPTPLEALKLLEDDLRVRVGRSKKFRAAETPTATEDKKDATAGDSGPTTLTSRGSAVPITPKPKPSRKMTALERLAEARREVGDA